MIKRKIRVLIVEDSLVYQKCIRQILDEDEQIEVCGMAHNGREAVKLIQKENPDVITLDLELPDVTGTELLEKLVKQYPIPIVVVTSKENLYQKVVEIGAKDIVWKIADNSPRMKEQFALRLKMKVKMQAISFSGKNTPSLSYLIPRQNDVRSSDSVDASKGLILIGASLGGTETTLEILKDLSADLPGIVIVQHMTDSFTASYANRLNNRCKMSIHEARDGEVIRPGTALVAKGGMQLCISKSIHGYEIHLKKNDGLQTFCPSVDTMFASAAEVAGKNVTAVILTGMGHDGAKGMKALHDAGAYTIAENQDTSVVYGMPRAAVEAGGVDIELPKQEIAAEIMKKYDRHWRKKDE